MCLSMPLQHILLENLLMKKLVFYTVPWMAVTCNDIRGILDAGDWIPVNFMKIARPAEGMLHNATHVQVAVIVK